MMDKQDLTKVSHVLYENIVALVERARSKAALFINAETTLLYWSIGQYVENELRGKDDSGYGKQILVTLSQQLTEKLGKGFSYSALTRMVKVANCYDSQNIATLSQQLSWSHFIELAAVDSVNKREFYMQLTLHHRWKLRALRAEIDAMRYERTAIATKPEELIEQSLKSFNNMKKLDHDLVFKNTYVLDFLNLPANYSEKELENALISNIEQFLLELGSGFAFVERQKRIPVDATDYHLDLLFYHRKLKRLVAIDLKLGKFRAKHKAQMELYLRWLQKNEMQEGEQKPIGLLLCSEGNTEHIELLMLDEKDIKVAQYLTELPSKAWFADKLHRAIELAKSQTSNYE